jgi:CBS domain-containing protein
VLVAERHGCALARACWLAFGSEGRSEQTIATDQDNGLLFDSADPERDRPAWLAMGDDVNQWLAACGYPLCKGGVMAGSPACCLSADEWATRFGTWIGRGEPEDLLAASIFFDLRALAGQSELAAPLQDLVVAQAPGSPRFLRLLAENALRRRPPLNWRGTLDPQEDGSHRWVDLKLQGTAIFVDAARLFVLAHGLRATGTRERLLAAARPLRVPDEEAASWVSAFEYLQLFRLRLQAGQESDAEHPNRIDLATLDAIHRRILKEAFRVARGLQERIELDLLR